MLTKVLEEFAGKLEKVAVPVDPEEVRALSRASKKMSTILQYMLNKFTEPSFLNEVRVGLETSQKKVLFKKAIIEAGARTGLLRVADALFSTNQNRREERSREWMKWIDEEQRILVEIEVLRCPGVSQLLVVLKYIEIWESKFGNTVPNLDGIADYSLLIRSLLASDILPSEDLEKHLGIILTALCRSGEQVLDLSKSTINPRELRLLISLLPKTTIKRLNLTGIAITNELLAVLIEGLENTDVIAVEGIALTPELEAVLRRNNSVDPDALLEQQQQDLQHLAPLRQELSEKIQGLLAATEQIKNAEENMRLLEQKMATLEARHQRRLKKIEEDVFQKLQDVVEQQEENVQKNVELEAALAKLEQIFANDINSNNDRLERLSQEVGNNRNNIKTTEQGIREIKRALAPEFWIDVEEDLLLRRAKNNNAKIVLKNIESHLDGWLRRCHLIKLGIIDQRSLGWDIAEPTPLLDIKESMVQAVRGGVSVGQAVADAIPVVAVVTKVAEKGYNAYQKKRKQKQVSEVHRAVHRPSDMEQMGRRIATTLVNHHLEVINNLREPNNNEQLDESDPVCFAKLLVQKMLAKLKKNRIYTLAPENIERLMLKGVESYSKSERDKFGPKLQGLDIRGIA
jgi:hypothetical protein